MAHDYIRQLIKKWEDQQRAMEPVVTRFLAAQSFADKFLAWIESTENAIQELGGDPADPAWDDWIPSDLLRMADLAKETKDRYGATLRIEPQRGRDPRGRKGYTPEELMELKMKLERRAGTSQQQLATWFEVSRYKVQMAEKYCRENPIIYRQYQAAHVGE